MSATRLDLPQLGRGRFGRGSPDGYGTKALQPGCSAGIAAKLWAAALGQESS